MKNNTVLDQIVIMANMMERQNMAGNTIAIDDIRCALEKFVDDVFPSGSGFDMGTKLISASDTKVILETEYHHMNECGYYTDWTKHKIIITGTINSYTMRITGRNKNQIKEVIADFFIDCCDMDMNDVRMPEQYRNAYYNNIERAWMKHTN